MKKQVVTKIIEIDYGHTLPDHYGFCSQIHGHRAKIEVTVSGDVYKGEGSKKGMVIDFSFLKHLMMKKIHAKLDHGFAVWKDDKEDLAFIKKRNTRFLITDLPPTAEILAEWAFREIKSALKKQVKEIVILERVRWWETPNSYASYPLE